MTTERTFHGLREVRLPPKPLHLAIGMFDGVHRGHQAVVESAVTAARRSGGLAGVLTFWPHPSRLFRPDKPTLQIMEPETKRAFLLQLGIDFIVEQPFDREFAAITAEAFVPFLKTCLPQLCCLYVGENWRYGKGRTGDIHSLVGAAGENGINVVSAERVNVNAHPVSSTRVREHLASGEIERANELLGYRYFAEGPILPGRKLGRTIGFPTLNMRWQPEQRPAFGVYAVRTARADDPAAWVDGVANYGKRPTVERAASEPLLEVHLLANSNFEYGDELIVEWLTFLRPEKRFPSLEDLKKQIESDRDRAVAYFQGMEGRGIDGEVSPDRQ